MINLSDLETVSPGIINLSPKEHEAIQKFTLLWTLFEAQILDSNASAKMITEKVEKIDLNIISSNWFEEQFIYFSERYITDGEINNHFSHLYLRKNDNPDLVRSVLIKENEDPYQKLIACLIIVYRLRNNFFHGLKWAYGLKDQLNNFTHSVNLLKKYLEIVPHDV